MATTERDTVAIFMAGHVRETRPPCAKGLTREKAAGGHCPGCAWPARHRADGRPLVGRRSFENPPRRSPPAGTWEGRSTRLPGSAGACQRAPNWQGRASASAVPAGGRGRMRRRFPPCQASPGHGGASRARRLHGWGACFCPHIYAFSPRISRSYTDQQNFQVTSPGQSVDATPPSRSSTWTS